MERPLCWCRSALCRRGHGYSWQPLTYNQNQAEIAVDHDYDGAGLLLDIASALVAGFGGFVGWNAQRGNLVFGAEVGVGTADLKSNLVFNADDDIDEVTIGTTATVAGRLGYARGSTLAYLMAGVTYADISNVGGDVNGGELTESDAQRRDE